MDKDKCILCGLIKKLTYEHIPPKASGNNSRIKIVGGDELLRFVTEDDKLDSFYKGENDLKYNIRQKGSVFKVLCEKCNNVTGNKNIPGYLKVTKCVEEVISKIPNKIQDGYLIELIMEKEDYLHFIKHCITMCYITNSRVVAEDNLYNFIMNKEIENLELNNKLTFGIELLIPNESIATFRTTGVIAAFYKSELISYAMLDANPFKIVMFYSDSLECGFKGANLLKAEKINDNQVMLKLRFTNSNNPMCYDIRSKEQIIADASNKKK